MNTLAPFRVGSVPYLNAAPLTRGLENEISFVAPSRLAEQLDRGELDGALVSIVAALFSQKYDILDGVAIASVGEVKSVLLGHRRPLSEAREVFCDTASLTSVQLMRVLLAERGLHPKLKMLPSYECPQKLPDYVMLIGDQALNFLHSSPEHQILDLGASWFELTGLPFVYAVWALRRGLENQPLRRRLLEAKKLGNESLEEIVRSRTEFTYAFRKEYLSRNVRYDLGAAEKRGVIRFIELLRKHGPTPVFEPVYVDCVRAT